MGGTAVCCGIQHFKRGDSNTAGRVSYNTTPAAGTRSILGDRHGKSTRTSFELINFMELIGESMGIGEQPAELAQLKALLAPCLTEDMICWPVSLRVGNVKNNDPSLIEPVIPEFPAMIVTA